MLAKKSEEEREGVEMVPPYQDVHLDWKTSQVLTTSGARWCPPNLLVLE